MEWDDPIYALVLLIFGFVIFFGGFKKFRQKRMVEDIPTSTIRGLAMGLVEIIGTARIGTGLISPLNHQNCVYYKYLIERYEKQGKSSRWVKIAGGDSSAVPFIVEDGTGKILVHPVKAECIMPEDYKYETGSFGTLPDNLERFVKTNKLSYKGLFGIRHRLRFREWIIQEGNPVYVLGTAQKSARIYREMNEKAKKLMSALKKDPVRQKRIDLDGDGNISYEEWKLAEDRIKKSLLDKMVTSAQTGDVQDVMIAKGEKDEPFLISDQSQKYLRKQLTRQSALQIVIGGILAVAGMAFTINLIFRFWNNK